MAVVSVIALLAVSKVSVLTEQSRITAARHDISVLREAFVNAETGYIGDMRGIPGFSLANMRISNLFVSTNVYGYVHGGIEGGERLDEVRKEGAADPAVFTKWNELTRRGWRGPYVRMREGMFPHRDERRFDRDAAFRLRGFFPSLTGLCLPADFVSAKDGCSVYGFPGETTALDPWGNPYVLQIPPPQAFRTASGQTAASQDEKRFTYARVVSAGPDGRLDTPCFSSNATNSLFTSWTERSRRMSRQAGLVDGSDFSARGDDIVVFLVRADVDEGESDEK